MPDKSDEFEDELDEREDPDPEDADWNLDPAVIACPLCGGEISEESEFCHHCKNYVAKDARRPKPLWFVVGVIVVIAAIFVVWVMR